eukprot:TRINITY_DN5301_c0_g1_i10.p1 TRINITY_DN5301_c0_g1~~TRINITY_DN5301_c0_g1_i10.p1  ORF type:complete len:626 (+),score=241.10 TRINITY_DN5301_c0_g1_i10:84-1961(+)
MASTPGWGGVIRPIPTPTAAYDDSGVLLHAAARSSPLQGLTSAALTALDSGRLSPPLGSVAPVLPPRDAVTVAPAPLGQVSVNAMPTPLPRGKSLSPSAASLQYVGGNYRGRNTPPAPVLYSTAPVIERMGGSTKGPTIFVPGTTITKEDVEILNMRYAADMEEANAEIAELTEQLNGQRALTKELTTELERTRTREKSILRTTKHAEEHKAESGKQLEAVSALLEATERELIAKTNDLLKVREENDILAGQLARVKDDLEAECREGDMLRSRFQKQEGEIESAKNTLASQQKQTDELMKVNGLYKATHEKYVKEGQLASQLITTVETLKREVTEAEARMIELQNARVNEARALLGDLKDGVNVLIPLLVGVKELSAAQDAVRGGVQSPQAHRERQYEECFSKLREAASAELLVEVKTPALANLASIVGDAKSPGSDPGAITGIDIPSLKRELEAMQQNVGKDAQEANAKNLLVLRDVCRKMSEVLSVCVGEVQTAHSQQTQEIKHMMTLQDQISRENEKNGPLLEQLERLGAELSRWQKEAGTAQARLEHEVTSNRDIKEAHGAMEYREKDLLRRLEAAQLENERMKTFMAKLQIADVPQLHNILQSGGRASSKHPSVFSQSTQ